MTRKQALKFLASDEGRRVDVLMRMAMLSLDAEGVARGGRWRIVNREEFFRDARARLERDGFPATPAGAEAWLRAYNAGRCGLDLRQAEGSA